MSASKDARGREGNGVVVDNHLNVSREGVEGGRTDNGTGVGFVDYYIWHGAKETSGIHFNRVKDGNFVGAENLGIVVRHT